MSKYKVYLQGEKPVFGFKLKNDTDFEILDTSYGQVYSSTGVKQLDKLDVIVSKHDPKESIALCAVNTASLTYGHYMVRCILDVLYLAADDSSYPMQGKIVTDYYKFYVREEEF